jgi:hypothetical protein
MYIYNVNFYNVVLKGEWCFDSSEHMFSSIRDASFFGIFRTVKNFEKKVGTNIFTCYIPTKLIHEKNDLWCGVCKKYNFVKKIDHLKYAFLVEGAYAPGG